MAITYDEIAYDEIELGLRSIISKEFANVYIANNFVMKGNECIRINLISSTSLEPIISTNLFSSLIELFSIV